MQTLRLKKTTVFNQVQWYLCAEYKPSITSHQKWKEKRNHYRLYKEQLWAIQLKMFFFGPSLAELRDLTRHGSVEGACNALSTVTPHFLDGLTLHSSPWLQSGLRQNELWRRLRQDVVAKYLLGWRRRCRRHAHCVQKHWSALLVLRPNWCRVVEVLEASRDLNRGKNWKEY